MINPAKMNDKNLLEELQEYGQAGQRDTETLYHHSEESTKKGGSRHGIDKDKTGERWQALLAEARNRGLIKGV